MTVLPSQPGRRRLLLAAMPLLLVAGYAFVIRPARVAQTATLSARLARLRASSGAPGRAGSVPPKAHGKITAYERDLRGLEPLLPSAEELPELLEAVAARAAAVGFQLTLVRQDSVVSSGPYSRQLYAISGVGLFDAVGRFVVALGSLPRIATPVRMKLALANEAAAHGAPRLRADLQVETIVAAASGRTARLDSGPAADGDAEQFTWPASAVRDPFTPEVERASQPPSAGILLRGVIFAADGAGVAVLTVDGKTYRRRRGEWIGQARIAEILPTRVMLSVAGSERGRQVLELKHAAAGHGGVGP